MRSPSDILVLTIEPLSPPVKSTRSVHGRFGPREEPAWRCSVVYVLEDGRRVVTTETHSKKKDAVAFYDALPRRKSTNRYQHYARVIDGEVRGGTLSFDTIDFLSAMEKLA